MNFRRQGSHAKFRAVGYFSILKIIIYESMGKKEKICLMRNEIGRCLK
jgi:hypothetical protein